MASFLNGILIGYLQGDGIIYMKSRDRMTVESCSLRTCSGLYTFA